MNDGLGKNELMRVELASLYGIDTCTAFVRVHADGSATVNHGHGNARYPKGCWRRVGDAPSALSISYGGMRAFNHRGLVYLPT